MPRRTTKHVSPLRDEDELHAPKEALRVSDLHWTEQEALETYFRLRSFEDDWDAPGMEAYDAL